MFVNTSIDTEYIANVNLVLLATNGVLKFLTGVLYTAGPKNPACTSVNSWCKFPPLLWPWLWTWSLLDAEILIPALLAESDMSTGVPPIGVVPLFISTQSVLVGPFFR
jgi:hypothetical protein